VITNANIYGYTGPAGQVNFLFSRTMDFEESRLHACYMPDIYKIYGQSVKYIVFVVSKSFLFFSAMDSTVGETDVAMDPSQTLRPTSVLLTGSTSRKRRRSRSPRNAPGPSRALKKARLERSMHREPLRPKSASSWHIKKGEIPDDAKKTKVRNYSVVFLVLFELSARP
jgi:hypothetical protein